MSNTAREMWAANLDAFLRFIFCTEKKCFLFICSFVSLFQRGKAIEPILRFFPCHPDLAKVTALSFLGTSCGLTF